MKNSLDTLYKENGIEKEIRSSLNHVILGITFGMIFFNITTGPALTGLAKALGASEFVFGLLMALPVFGGLMQIVASSLLEKTRERKKIFMIFGILQRVLWIPVAFVPYVVPEKIHDLRIWSVIVFITMSSFSGAFLNVTFYSWIGDLIPIKVRGRYFSIRTRISTISGLIGGLVTAKLLDVLPGFQGYATVFIIAGIFGTADILSFIRVKDIPMTINKNTETMMDIIKQAFKNSAFLKYITFWTVWGFGINFAAPFFNLYALEGLKMSFTEITLTGQIVCNLTTIFFITKWGKFLDVHGGKPILYFTCISTAILPVFWLFATPHNYFPVLLFNLIGGMIWCGTDITSQNMLISNTPVKNRSMYIAIYSAVTTIFGNALAYIAGGYFLERIKGMNLHIFLVGHRLNHYEIMFLLAAVLRLAAVLIFLPGVPDEKSSSLRSIYSAARTRFASRWQRINPMR